MDTKLCHMGRESRPKPDMLEFHRNPDFCHNDCRASLLLLIDSNGPTFSDRYTWANSVDPDQTAPLLLLEESDQDLHCLPFCLHHFGLITIGRALLFKEPGSIRGYFSLRFSENLKFLNSCILHSHNKGNMS